MKILLVNTYYYPEIYGGAEYSVKKLAEELKQQGHTVKVLCTGSEAKREVIDGIDVIRVFLSFAVWCIFCMCFFWPTKNCMPEFSLGFMKMRKK